MANKNHDAKGRFSAGDMARFSGTAVGGTTSGDFNVKVINPHSNAHEVTHTDSRGRQYSASGAHIPRATVEKPERKSAAAGKTFPAYQFEAYHHNLSKL